MRGWTQILSAGSTITIDASDYAYQLSIQANDNSSGTIKGNLTWKGMPSMEVPIENGETFTYTAPTNSPIDGFTISCISGTVDVILCF